MAGGRGNVRESRLRKKPLPPPPPPAASSPPTPEGEGAAAAAEAEIKTANFSRVGSLVRGSGGVKVIQPDP